MSNPALDPKRSASVQASAGSGKTYTLSARIVRLLLDGAAPGGILALTFTRKAAAEMRERVEQRLASLAFADDGALRETLQSIGAPTDDDTLARARGLHEAVCKAPFGLRCQTLHSFYAELLGRFPLEAQVPAGFTLLDDEGTAIADVVAHTLAQAAQPTGHDHAALQALCARSLQLGHLQSLLGGALHQRGTLRPLLKQQGKPFLAMLRAGLTLPADGEDPKARMASADVTEAFAALERYSDGHAKVDSLSLTPIWDALLLADPTQRFEALAAALLTGAGKPRSCNRPGKLTNPVAFKSALESVQNAMADALQMENDLRCWRGHNEALPLLLACLARWDATCKQRGILGFAEAEHHAALLLREDASWVRYRLDTQLQHLLIDEFQDLSPLQWQMVQNLIAEFSSPSDTARTVFIVGDAKQSIYGFRGSDSSLLGTAANAITAALAAHRHSLDTSYRSATAVMEAVNAHFAARPGFTPQGTDKRDMPGQVCVLQLVQRANAQSAKEDSEAGTEPKGFRDPLRAPLPDAEAGAAAREAELVAEQIAALIGNTDYPIPHTTSTQAGAWRAPHAGDVLVLARKRKHLQLVEAALARRGIPYLGSANSGLLQTVLAQDLLALLQHLHLPHRNVPLATVLRSPLFALDDAALQTLADTARAENDRRPVWSAALATLAAQQPQSLWDAIHRQLAHWRTLARQLPPHDLIDRIASESRLIARYRAARPQDARTAENLGALLQWALDINQGRFPGLASLLRAAALGQTGSGIEEPPPRSTTPRVRLMTIHSAKGLEAPIVMVMACGAQKSAADSGWVQHGERAVFKDLARNSSLLSRIKDAKDVLQSSEQQNLLYVALTRARQYLWVSAHQSGNSSDQGWYSAVHQTLFGLTQGSETPCLRSGPPTWPKATTNAPSTEAQGVRLQRASYPSPAFRAAPSAQQRHGIRVHWLLQQLAPPARPRPQDVLRAQLSQLQGPMTDREWQCAVDEADIALGLPALAALQLRATKCFSEWPLFLPHAEFGSEQRVMDRLLDCPDALHIIDYKTSNAAAAVIVEQAQSQLQAYGAAVSAIFPARAVVLWVLLTHHQQLVRIA